MPSSYIDREECIGDSLVKINSNFAGLDTDITNNFNSLRTLINTLSTNMNKIGNYPYVEFALVCAPNTPVQAIPADSAATALNMGTIVLDQSNIVISYNTQTVTVPAGTYQYEGLTHLYGSTSNTGIILQLLNGSNIISRINTGGHTNGSYGSEYYPVITGQVTFSSPATLSLACIASVGVTVGPFDLPNVSTGNADQRTTLKLWKIG